jgi:hypothetical protein
MKLPSQFLDYVRRNLDHIFVRGKLFWLAIGLPVLCYFVASVSAHVWSRSAEDILRYSGALLEIAGIVTVAVGLLDLQDLFNRQTLWAAILAYFKTLPRWRPRLTVSPLPDASSSIGFKARAHGNVRLPPDATIEQRLRALEEQIENLSHAVHDNLATLDERTINQEKALKEEQRERRSEVESARKLIDVAVAGDLGFEIVGLLWLSLGLVVSTFAPEIAN